MRAAFVSIFMLTGILMWAAAVHMASNTSTKPALDGYGVSLVAG